jgi:FPC/CPF motif-containing protein YcgG
MIELSPPATKLAHPTTVPTTDWERDAVDRFSRRLLSKDRLFPCIFGVDALRKSTLRFTFVPAGEPGTEYLAAALEEFTSIAPELGRRTSLVAFFEPSGGVGTLADYERRTWRLLRDLHKIDPLPWPAGIPEDTESPEWEFCFAGMPMFVVVNTPAHRERMSRFFEYYCITFQPRFVFDDIAETSRQGKSARKVIRKRLSTYDTVPATPLLGSYGTPGNREWTQYFLADHNHDVSRLTRCPFNSSDEEES